MARPFEIELESATDSPKYYGVVDLINQYESKETKVLKLMDAAQKVHSADVNFLVLSKEHLKKDLAYVNSVISLYNTGERVNVSLSNEDYGMSIKNKIVQSQEKLQELLKVAIEETEEIVQEINKTPSEVIEQELGMAPKPEKENVVVTKTTITKSDEEVDSILPTEQTITEYTLTSPNLIYATTAAVAKKDNKDIISNEIAASALVGGAKAAGLISKAGAVIGGKTIAAGLGAAKGAAAMAASPVGLAALAGGGLAYYLIKSIDKEGIIADNVNRATSYVGEKIKDKANDLYEAGKDKAQELASRAGDAIKNKVSEGWDAVKEKAGNVASSAWDKVKETASGLTSNVKDKISDVKAQWEDYGEDEETKAANAARREGISDVSSFDANQSADSDDNYGSSSVDDDDDDFDFDLGAESYINSIKGREFLMSKEAQNYIIKMVTREEDESDSLVNMDYLPDLEKDVSSSEEDTQDDKKLPSEDEVKNKLNDTVIEMENVSLEAANAGAILEAHNESDEDVEEIRDDDVEELSDNADKITRLEDAQDLALAAMIGADNAQTETSGITVESARVFSQCVNGLMLEINDKLGITKDMPTISVSNEEAYYDPRGALLVSQEGIKDFFRKIWEAIKKAILKFIRWIKKLYRRVDVSIRIQAAKTRSLIRKLDKKGEVPLKVMNDSEIWKKYSNYIKLSKGSFSNLNDYYNGLKASPLGNALGNQLRECASIYSAMFTDLGNGKTDHVDKYVSKLTHVIYFGRINKLVSANRNKYLSAFDKGIVEKVKTKLGMSTVLIPIFVNNNKLFALKPESLRPDQDSYYKYKIVPVKDMDQETWKPNWKGAPSKNDINNLLTNLSKCVEDNSKLVRGLEAVTDYCYKFMDTFDKVQRDISIAGPTATNLIRATSGLSRFARMVAGHYVPYEILNFYINVRDLNNICSNIVDRMTVVNK